MTLVIAECVPRRTPWPRGLLLGLGIVLKLTPAVFLLYFLLNRDRRAVLTSLASVVAALAAGFALAWQDSWEYWTHTVRNTDRIGSASLNTNQNIAGTLARLGLDEHQRFLPWVAACFLVLALTIWAARRVLRAGEPTLAVICIALFGLGGIAGVLVASLGVDAADGGGDGRAGLAAAKRRHGRGQRRGGGFDGVDADRSDAQAPRGDRAAVASARRSVLSVVGAGDPGRRRSHRCRRRRYRARTPAIDCAGAGIRGQLIGYPAAVCGIRDDDCWPDGAEPLPFLSVAA